MHRLAPFCLLLGYLLYGCGQNAAAPAEAFPPFYPEAQPFRSAIGLTKSTPLPFRITGLTVPHHLLAADLIASAFALASGQAYRRIIILSPDHFSRSRTPFAVSIRNFQTVMGEVRIDAEAVARLRQLLAAHKGERFAVGQFKDWTGVSRKYAIPLLEFLDRERVTCREGDSRVVL